MHQPYDLISQNMFSMQDLVSKLIVKDPKKRLTAKQALAHPWVQVRFYAILVSQTSDWFLRSVLIMGCATLSSSLGVALCLVAQSSSKVFALFLINVLHVAL